MMSGKKYGRPFTIFVLELLHIHTEFSEGLVPGMAIRRTQCIQHRRGPAWPCRYHDFNRSPNKATSKKKIQIKISKNSTNPRSHQKKNKMCVFLALFGNLQPSPPKKNRLYNHCRLPPKRNKGCLGQQSPVLLDKDFVAPNPMVIVQSQRCPNILGWKWPVDSPCSSEGFHVDI